MNDLFFNSSKSLYLFIFLCHFYHVLSKTVFPEIFFPEQLVFSFHDFHVTTYQHDRYMYIRVIHLSDKHVQYAGLYRTFWITYILTELDQINI